MKRNPGAFLRKCRFPVILALGSVPVVVLLFVYMDPALVPWAWVFPTAYVLLTAVSLLLPGRWRLPYGIFMAAAQLALCFLLAPPENRVFSLIATGLYGILLLWSLRIAGWSGKQEISAFWGFFGVAAHMLSQFVLRNAVTLDQALLAPAASWLMGAFLIFAVLVMLSLNRGSLTEAGGQRQNASVSMRRKNVLLTLGLFAAALLISLVPAVISGIQGIFRWLGKLISYLSALITFGSGDREPTDATGETEDLSQLMGQSGGEASQLAQILETIAMGLCTVALAALAVWLLWRLGKKLLELLRRLWAAMGRYASHVAEDYEDEITDTRDSGGSERLRRGEKRRQMRAARKLARTPGERIRFRYQYLSARHPEWTPDTTARENLPGEAARLYERARYSGHPVTEAEAERFEDGTKGLPGRKPDSGA